MTDAYICAGLRTPIGRFGGALAPVRPDDMAAHVLRAVMDAAPDLPPGAVDEVVMGCANQAGEDNRDVARMATLLAGLPESVPGVTMNRLCGSGLDAVGMAARAIRTGEAEVVLAGGVESMTRAPLVMPKPDAAWSRKAEVFDTTIGWRFVNKALAAQYGAHSMPETAENVAEDFNVSRADQDAFARRSQERCAAAQEAGRLAREIAPIEVRKSRKETVTVDTDEHPRLSPLEKLASLPTPFREGGTVTAGNASGVNDGAAALLVASGAAADRYGLTRIARVAGMATAGVAPRIMGIGPVPATRRLLDRMGLAITDIDLIELNEAFAAQSLAVLRELGLPDDADHVNPNGGAIALGHPLGMSGARLALTAALQMQTEGHKRALCTMCVGVGQGISLLLETP
ncbi:3-oxoadipyl-CoA thiolase [Roseovarius spongiae]|uniref:Beta-ketoadipyl-CoA thiolase n=1 Tax=Roseovarius spongiae TaxID=2320272 RepID=A0A3A8B4R3_9RHOB|nr:3-oxoadipyl-CoA thiolase [Roseovarius spongiae]RKF16811.1 3-oxoadipyl-CoA thiolase [Roseovarius spongiae]